MRESKKEAGKIFALLLIFMLASTVSATKISFDFTSNSNANGFGDYSIQENDTWINIELNNLQPNETYSIQCLKTNPQNTSEELNICIIPFTTDNGKEKVNFNIDNQNTSIKIAIIYENITEKSEILVYTLNPLNCMQKATIEREDKIISAFNKHHESMISVLEKRKDAMTTAWGKNKIRDRIKALKNSWMEYQDEKRQAEKELQKTKQEAWRGFYQDRADCGSIMNIDDPLTTQYSEEHL